MSRPRKEGEITNRKTRFSRKTAEAGRCLSCNCKVTDKNPHTNKPYTLCQPDRAKQCLRVKARWWAAKQHVEVADAV